MINYYIQKTIYLLKHLFKSKVKNKNGLNINLIIIRKNIVII